jgi:hypothetical protein
VLRIASGKYARNMYGESGYIPGCSSQARAILSHPALLALRQTDLVPQIPGPRA